MDNKEYYETFNWDDAKLNERLKEKVQQILSIIPIDVNTILDVGCGDGELLLQLKCRKQVDGMGLEFQFAVLTETWSSKD